MFSVERGTRQALLRDRLDASDQTDTTVSRPPGVAQSQEHPLNATLSVRPQARGRQLATRQQRGATRTDTVCLAESVSGGALAGAEGEVF